MNLASGLGIALALSAAANLGLTHLYLGKRDELATQKQVTEQFGAAAQSCSKGVESLASEGQKRHQAVLDALAKTKGAVDDLNMAATDALTSKPDDPNDLCGSADRFLRREIEKERAKP